MMIVGGRGHLCINKNLDNLKDKKKDEKCHEITN